MRKLFLLVAATGLTSLCAQSQVTLKDKDGKEYKMEVIFDDPSICPKFAIHVFQPTLVASESAFFFAPNLGADVNVNDKLKLTVDFAPSISESNVSIKSLPQEIQGSAHWANFLDVSGSYTLKSKMGTKNRKVVIGGGGNVYYTTKMPLKRMSGIALRGGYLGFSTTPRNAKSITDANGDFKTYTLTNRKASALVVGPSFVTRATYQVVLDGQTFVGYAQNEIYAQFGFGLQSSHEVFEGNQGSAYVKLDGTAADALLQDPSGMAWRVGIRSMRYRPDATICKYFYAGGEFGSLPASSFDSGKIGFFRFFFGYTFGQDIRR